MEDHYSSIVCYTLALPSRQESLPRGVDLTLEKEFNVFKEFASMLGNKVADHQLTASHTLSVDTRKISGAHAAFMLTKNQRITKVNSERRHLTFRQLKTEIEEYNVDNTKSKFQWWKKAMGAKQVS